MDQASEKQADAKKVTARSFKQIFSSREYFIATLKQFLKFGFIGILNTIIAWSIYYAFIWNGQNIYVGNTVGFLCGVVNAYLWNIFWVFKGNGQGFKKTLPKFFGVYLLTYLLGMLLIYLVVDVAKLGYMANWMPVINSAISMVVNFLVSKFWTFKS